MTPFLYLTAEDLYRQFGDDLPNVAVVFPNNRARLFFSEHLYKIAGKPLWSPSFTTISSLFDQHADQAIVDSLGLVQILYEVYSAISTKKESFDEFYLWGEILVSDFDDVDKNLVDARQLFKNIQEQAQYTDTLEHLSEEQVESIRLFFKNFDPDRKTELKRRFLENWNILLDVYEQFTKRLKENKLAYEGLQHRTVVEKIRREGCEWFEHKTYAFVGFNVLNECEKALFTALKKAGKAQFYWDYDEYYIANPRHEAGRFMQKNLEHYPNSLERTEFNSFEKQAKTIQLISSSTENAGARFIPKWISQLQEKTEFVPEETTIVLCNEGLLLPVLHSIPDFIQELNVTMGFPLLQTPICILTNQIAALHSDGFIAGSTPKYNHRFVLPILQHPLVRMFSEEADQVEQKLRKSNRFRPDAKELQCDDLLTIIFTPAQSPAALTSCLINTYEALAACLNSTDKNDDFDPLLSEALFRCHNLTSRISELLDTSIAEITLLTYRKLLQQVLSRASIPFSGEPVRGLQIMGLLETRNLDFKNILMLSVNEGMLPKGSTEVSFIPYNLRKAFGLTTNEHKDSIFAYYFFRLIQRAEHISLVYNTSNEGINRGEMSRFLLQLQLESNLVIQQLNLTSSIELTAPRKIVIEKTPEILEHLHEQYNKQVSNNAKALSPTALNSLLDCSLRFYFKYVAHLHPPTEISDEVDNLMLGNLFHHAAEYIYTSILLQKAGLPYDASSVYQSIKDAFINKALSDGQISGIINANDLEPWLKGIQSIEKVVDLFFQLDFFQLGENSTRPPYNGEQLVRRNLLIQFLKTLLKQDSEKAPFELLGMEMHVQGMAVDTDLLKVQLGGNIDRLEKKEGVTHLIDYKSGGIAKSAKELDSLFKTDKNRPYQIFQLFTYAAILQKKDPNCSIKPELLFINRAGKTDYSSDITFGSKQKGLVVNAFKPYEDDFNELLSTLIQQLFDPNIAFTQTAIVELCEVCDYKNICRRSKNQKNS